MKREYLLTGGSGILGTELQKYLECYAPSRSVFDIKWSENMIRKRGLELIGYSATNNYRQEFICRGIIHAAAYTDVPKSEINQKEAIETNIIGTKNVAFLGKKYNLPVYYISTDYVYEGIRGHYSENDRTKPVNFYGFTKLAGEAFLDIDKDLIIRTSFKPKDLWVKKYKGAFADIYSSTDYVDIVAQHIAFVIFNGLTGIYNVATDRKSIYDLAVKSNPNVKMLYKDDENLTVNMPKDISMDISKYKDFLKNNISKFGEFIKK